MLRRAGDGCGRFPPAPDITMGAHKIICPQCKKDVPEGVVFCAFCGASMAPQPRAGRPFRLVAVALGIGLVLAVTAMLPGVLRENRSFRAANEGAKAAKQNYSLAISKYQVYLSEYPTGRHSRSARQAQAGVTQKLRRQTAQFYSAIGRCNVTTVSRLLGENPALAQTVSAEGEYALHRATTCRSVTVAELLISHGADINARNTNGETPIFDAAAAAVVDLEARAYLKFLISKGADVNVRSNNNWSPLASITMAQLVFPKGVEEVSQILRSAGAVE